MGKSRKKAEPAPVPEPAPVLEKRAPAAKSPAPAAEKKIKPASAQKVGKTSTTSSMTLLKETKVDDAQLTKRVVDFLANFNDKKNPDIKKSAEVLAEAVKGLGSSHGVSVSTV